MRFVNAFVLSLSGVLLASSGCSSSREIVKLTDEHGRPVPIVYRHEALAKDSETREPVAGALVGVKSSDDAVWQVTWTDASGRAFLSQEYAEGEVYNDRRSFFFVETENVTRLRAPGFELCLRHPGYDHVDSGYGSEEFLDTLIYGASGDPAYAHLVHPRLCMLDRVKGSPDPPTTTATVRESMAALLELAPPEFTGQRDGPIMGGLSVGPPVNGGRFLRTCGPGGSTEWAAKLYYRADDQAYVLVGVFEPGHARSFADICDTAELAFFGGGAFDASATAPSSRWLLADRPGASDDRRADVIFAGLDAAVRAGSRRVALYYPIALAPKVDERLRAERFDLLAEWWRPQG